MHCLVSTLSCRANEEFFKSIRYFDAASFCANFATKFELLAARMLDAKGARRFDWDYLVNPRPILNNSNCFDIARLSKLNKIINHETVQLKIEEIYYGGLSSSNRTKTVSLMEIHSDIPVHSRSKLSETSTSKFADKHFSWNFNQIFS